jgi:hypothetical protein
MRRAAPARSLLNDAAASAYHRNGDSVEAEKAILQALHYHRMDLGAHDFDLNHATIADYFTFLICLYDQRAHIW